MNPAILFGIVRHLLTIGAGALASKGVINADETETAVGAVLALVGLVWSAIDKKRQAKKLVRAEPVE
jgi:hypothetical protein